MTSTSNRRAAESIGELDVHLGYLQDDLQKVVAAVANMATKDDLRSIEQRMSLMATKAELSALEEKLQSASVPSLLQKVASTATWATKVGAGLAVVGASGGAVAHWLGLIK